MLPVRSIVSAILPQGQMVYKDNTKTLDIAA